MLLERSVTPQALCQTAQAALSSRFWLCQISNVALSNPPEGSVKPAFALSNHPPLPLSPIYGKFKDAWCCLSSLSRLRRSVKQHKLLCQAGFGSVKFLLLLCQIHKRALSSRRLLCQITLLCASHPFTVRSRNLVAA